MEHLELKEICAYAVKMNGSTAAAAREMGVSRPTFYAWVSGDVSRLRGRNKDVLIKYPAKIHALKKAVRGVASHVLSAMGLPPSLSCAMPVTSVHFGSSLSLVAEDCYRDEKRFCCIVIALAKPELTRKEVWALVKRDYYTRKKEGSIARVFDDERLRVYNEGLL